jgi:hypothetical protein
MDWIYPPYGVYDIMLNETAPRLPAGERQVQPTVRRTKVMKKSIFLIAAVTTLICGYSDSFAKWDLQTLSDNPQLLNVSAVSRDVAWILAGTTPYSYRTTDGGDSWTPIANQPSSNQNETGL